MECQFCICKGNKIFKCTKQRLGIARRADLCTSHFYFLIRDNKLRVKQGVSIPDSFETIKKIGRLQEGLCTKEVDKMPDRPFPQQFPVPDDFELEVIGEEDIGL